MADLQRGGGTVAVACARLRACSAATLSEEIALWEHDARPGIVAAVASAKARVKRHESENLRLEELYRVQNELCARANVVAVGIDEVGRGAIAGPLSVGAVVLPAEPRIPFLNDSKKLSPARRQELDRHIREIAIACVVSHVPAYEVDRLGVTAALKRAMREAIAALPIAVDHVLIDGLPLGIHPAEVAIVKGDSRVASIAAASIIAKVERDQLMVQLSRTHPHYAFEVNKGYGTVEHLAAVTHHGPSPQHRRTFCHGAGVDSLF